MHLVPDRKAFGQRYHVKAGDDEAVNQDEGDAARDLGTPTVNPETFHIVPAAFQRTR